MGLFCLTHEFVFPEGKPHSCPYCENDRLRAAMAMEVERLRDEAKADGRTSGIKCWVRQGSGETVVTIVGDVRQGQWKRLLGLLVEIEKS